MIDHLRKKSNIIRLELQICASALGGLSCLARGLRSRWNSRMRENRAMMSVISREDERARTPRMREGK
jgi:hypothetical protein